LLGGGLRGSLGLSFGLNGLSGFFFTGVGTCKKVDYNLKAVAQNWPYEQMIWIQIPPVH
jgi:hypothetical protein